MIACAKLPQHGDQRVALQTVDFVDQQNQRLLLGSHPAAQGHIESAVAAVLLQHLQADISDERVVQHRLRTFCDLAQKHPHGLWHVLTRGLADLEVDIHATILTSGVESVGERQKRRGLACLAGSVENEVLLSPDQPQEVVQIDALQGRDAVVVAGIDRALGVEVPHAHLEYCMRLNGALSDSCAILPAVRKHHSVRRH